MYVKSSMYLLSTNLNDLNKGICSWRGARAHGDWHSLAIDNKVRLSACSFLLCVDTVE